MDQETSCGTGPILTTPGGWGLRNPEPKGPGQRTTYFSQFSAAVGGRKFGGIMTLLTIALRNVFRPWPRVTAHPGAPTNSRPPAFHGGTRRQPPLAAMRGWRDHVRHDAGREPPGRTWNRLWKNRMTR